MTVYHHSQAELIEAANSLYKQRDYVGLRYLLQAQPSRVLIDFPELGFMEVSALSRAGDQPKAVALADRLLKTRSGRANTSLNRRLLNAMAVADLEAGRSMEALYQWNYLLQKATAAGDSQIASWACVNIGIVKGLFCEWAEALAHFERARVAFHKSGTLAELSATHNNLGETYRQLQRYDLAIDNIEQAIEYGTVAGGADDLVMCHLSKSRIALDMGDLESARRVAGRCFAEFIQTGSFGREAEALMVLGDVALKNRAINEAEGYFLSALARAERHNIRFLQAECWERIAIVRDLKSDEKSRQDAAEKSVTLYQAIGAFARARKVLFEN